MAAAEYDFIVVGGGTAGCVLAARLSEDPDIRVLLLEAGGGARHPLVSIPLGVGLLHARRMFDWGYESEPEPNLAGRRIEMMRGRVLGGSSSINMMAHVRGHRGDFDRWAGNGCPGWSYDEILPYFRRSEAWQGGTSPARGGDGPVAVTWTTARDPLFDAWLAAAAEAGIRFCDDLNAGANDGIGRSQYALASGRRCSAEAGYLRPARRRPNLTVATAATATRLILVGGRATGVAYRRGGDTLQAFADRNILLAGGVFNTPKLLMQSGIGPADHLRQHGIPVALDRPEVGRNLQDHLAAAVSYARRGGSPFRAALRFDRLAVSMVRAWLFGTGPATVLPSGLHAFVRIAPDAGVPQVQFLFRGTARNAGPWFPGIRPPYAEGYSIRPVLLHPRSRGDLQLTGPDPADPLMIRPNFLSDPADLPVLREGIRLARALGASPAMAAMREAELRPGPEIRSDAEIDAWVRRVADTAHHPCGTCRMGSDAAAVVDPELRLRGLDGLVIADASVMPDLVSGNINATVMMIAEKAAALVTGRAASPASTDAA